MTDWLMYQTTVNVFRSIRDGICMRDIGKIHSFSGDSMIIKRCKVFEYAGLITRDPVKDRKRMLNLTTKGRELQSHLMETERLLSGGLKSQ